MKAESRFVSVTAVSWREPGAMAMTGRSSQPGHGRELLVVVLTFAQINVLLAALA